MCDGSRKLIAWLDGELPGEEAAAMERHVRACAECRGELGAYKKISKWMDAYCDAAALQVDRTRPGWAAVSAVVTAAAMAAAFLLFPHKMAERPAAELFSSATRAAAPVTRAALPEIMDSPVKKKSRLRHAVLHAQSQGAGGLLPEPTVEVAIPTEDMFAPGAVPEGVHFVANLSMGADGTFGISSASLIESAESERKPDQP